MFPIERDWILSKVHPILSEIKTVLDIGSETPAYRNDKQKYICELYKALEANNCKITTLDINPTSQADIICDISKKIELNNTFDLVFATNILEHIVASNFEEAVGNIKKLVGANKYLIVTVPYKLALHNAPIDNGFRPSVVELWDLFKDQFSYISGEIWKDKHYREPYISNPDLEPLPEVTGLFLRKSCF